MIWEMIILKRRSYKDTLVNLRSREDETVIEEPTKNGIEEVHEGEDMSDSRESVSDVDSIKNEPLIRESRCLLAKITPKEYRN